MASSKLHTNAGLCSVLPKSVRERAFSDRLRACTLRLDAVGQLTATHRPGDTTHEAGQKGGRSTTSSSSSTRDDASTVSPRRGRVGSVGGFAALPLGTLERRVSAVQAMDSHRYVGFTRFIAILSRFGRQVTRPRSLTPRFCVAVGAFPPFLWTFLFKQAKHIPTEIRPPVSRPFVFTFVFILSACMQVTCIV